MDEDAIALARLDHIICLIGSCIPSAHDFLLVFLGSFLKPFSLLSS